MTNEELCLQIQQGHDELIPVLWTQCQRYISMMASKYIRAFPQLDDSIKEDCVQEAYFSFLDAIRLYKEQESSFLHYLTYHLTNGFRAACFSGRGARREKDPLNNAVSLDAQTGEMDGEGCTLVELIPEKEQWDQTEYVLQPELALLEEADYWKSVNRFLHNAFDESPNEAGKAVFHYMLDNDCGYREAIRGLFGEDAFQDGELMSRLQYGIKKTRSDFQRYWDSGRGKEERKRLALDDAIFSNGMRSYGLKRFRSAGSFVESLAIRHIDK